MLSLKSFGSPGEQNLEQRGRSAQSISSPLLFLDESSLSVLVVNRHIKISPCCSPRCSDTVSSEEQKEDLLSSLLGNDERPRLVMLHLLHIPPWKIHVRTKLWQHQSHLLRVTAGKAGRVLNAPGSWQMNANLLPTAQRGDGYNTLDFHALIPTCDFN